MELDKPKLSEADRWLNVFLILSQDPEPGDTLITIKDPTNANPKP